jgi:hypothetical protein
MKVSGKQVQKTPAKTPGAARATAPAAREAKGLLELQGLVGNRAVCSLLSAPGVVQRRAIPGAAASATPQATAAPMPEERPRVAPAASFSFANLSIAAPKSRVVDAVGGKVTVGRNDDPLEREADRTAEQALNRPAPQRPAQETRSPLAVPQISPALAREVLGSKGRPLDAESRAFFEPHLQRDLSAVRIHTGPHAERTADQLHAQAFTLGHHIAFGAGQHDPHSGVGRGLIGHELAHIMQARRDTAPVIRRRPKKGDVAKPGVVAIEAEYGSHEGKATLSTGDTVSIHLRLNELPVGHWRLIQEKENAYHFEQPKPEVQKRKFTYENPWISETRKEVTYSWAEAIDIIIKPNPKATAAQRIEALPDTVRHFLTTGSGRAASEPVLQSAAEAGKLLAEAGFTEEEATLLEEEGRVAKERGEKRPEADPLDWAQSYLKRRTLHRREAAKASDDLLDASKTLADEPLDYLTRDVETILKDQSSKEELKVGLQLAKRYMDQGWLKDIPGNTPDAKEQYIRNLAQAIKARLLHFETLLLRDLRIRANAGLDSADAALLQMDRRFVGMWNPTGASWGPGFLETALGKIRDDPDIKKAVAKRAEVERDLDRESAEDYKVSYQPPHNVTPRTVVAGYVSPDYYKREKVRKEQRELTGQAFTEVVRKKGRLSLPPGVDAQDILEEKDATQAQILLKNYLYDGRKKIARARDRMSDDKFVFSADIWLGHEQIWLREQLGGTLGSEIARLVDALARFRRSDTGFWEELLKIVEFVSMFIPGPVGWVLRAGTAVIQFNKTMERLADQSTRYGAGGSVVAPSSSEALKALVEFAVNLVPDASVLGKEASVGENLAKRSAEDASAALKKEATVAAKQGAAGEAEHLLFGGAGKPLPHPESPNKVYRIMSNDEAAKALKTQKLPPPIRGAEGERFVSLDSDYTMLFREKELADIERKFGGQVESAEQSLQSIENRLAQLKEEKVPDLDAISKLDAQREKFLAVQKQRGLANRAEAEKVIGAWHEAEGQQVVVEIELEPGALDSMLSRSVDVKDWGKYSTSDKDVFLWKLERGYGRNIGIPKWQLEGFNKRIKGIRMHSFKKPLGKTKPGLGRN